MTADVHVHVRAARRADAGAVQRAVTELLRALTGDPRRSLAAFGPTYAQLVADPATGGVLVADSGGAVVGVLTYACGVALRTDGAHLVVQELWVDPAWRRRGVGAALLGAVDDRARSLGIGRVEVGLPGASFDDLPATTAFYRGQGFVAVGERYRRTVEPAFPRVAVPGVEP
jgi:GNAT superfamily N-acetyltransferase